MVMNKEELTKRSELDRRSAVEIMNWTLGDGQIKGDLLVLNFKGWLDYKARVTGFKESDWTPSSPNSGQIFDVLDAMTSRGFEFKMEFGKNGDFYIESWYQNKRGISKNNESISTRNQAILETCLIALGKRGDSSG